MNTDKASGLKEPSTDVKYELNTCTTVPPIFEVWKPKTKIKKKKEKKKEKKEGKQKRMEENEAT